MSETFTIPRNTLTTGDALHITGTLRPVSLDVQGGVVAWKCFTCDLEIVEQGEGASARADAAKGEHDKFCDGLTP